MMPATPLLQKYLSGTASPEEAAVIDTWIQASGEHKAIFDRLWQLWQHTSANTSYATPDTQQEWNKLLQQLPSTVVPRPHSRLRITIAGIIVMAIVITGIILLWPGGNNQQVNKMTKQSSGAITRDTLFNNIVATLDTYSRIAYTTTASHSISLQQGSLFLQASADTAVSYRIDAGGVSIQPGKSSLYIAYDSTTAITTIQVATGSVTVHDEETTLVLQEGEAIDRYNRPDTFGAKYPANVNRYSYATRVFLFNDTPLKDAVHYLEKAYGLSIQFKTPAIGNCLITTRFDDKRIEYIMDIMSATLHFDYDYQRPKNTIYLSGNGCE